MIFKKINKILDRILNIRIPSLFSFTIVVILLVFLRFIVHGFTSFLGQIISLSKQCDNGILYYLYQIIIVYNNIGYSDIISIHIGIGAVLIGFSFFVAQSLVDKEDPEKGRVLLYKSYFFPLLSAEVLIFFSFLLFKNNIVFNSSAVLILGILIVVFIGKTINILIKDYLMEKAKKDMFFSVLKPNFIKILDNEFKRNSEINNFSGRLKEESNKTNGFVYEGIWGPINKTDYVGFSLEGEGFITKIFFKEFQKIIRRVKEMTGALLEYGDGTKISEYSSKNSSKNNLPVIYIIPKYLEENNGKVLFIKKSIFDINQHEKGRNKLQIQKLLNRAFILKYKPNIKEIVKLEMSKIKDRCFEAIKQGQSGSLEKLINLYVELVIEFYLYIAKYGGGFSSKQAQDAKLGIIFGQLSPIGRLTDDIEDVFNLALSTNNEFIIREILYLPIRLMRLSVDNKDFLIFEQFKNYPLLFYKKYLDIDNENHGDLKNLLLDRSWRFIKEFADYYLEHKLDEEYPETLFKEFSVSILKIFQSLLKKSFDKKDISSFGIYLNKVESLFTRLERFDYYNLESIYDYIIAKKQEMFFGLTSWILSELENNIENLGLKSFYDNIQEKLPSNIGDLTKLFLNVHNYDVEDFWGRGNRELKEQDGAYAQGIYILEKLEKLYAIKSLFLLEFKTNQEIKELELPYNRDLSYLAGGSRDLTRILENIKENSSKWTFILNGNQISKIDILRKLLDDAKTNQERDDLLKKRESNISLDKVELFKNSIIDNFYKNRGIRNILKYYGLIKNKTNKICHKKTNRLGINTLFDKAPFFDDSMEWHVHYMGQNDGFDFGRSMLMGENEEIIKILKLKLQSVNEDYFMSEILKYKNINDFFVLSVNGCLAKFLRDNKNKLEFIYKWQLNTEEHTLEEIIGILKVKDNNLPVYEIYDKTRMPYLFILNKKRLGKLIQYNPLNLNENINLKKDIFYINITEFIDGSDIMNEFINNPPARLKKIGDKEQQKDHLKDNVIIKILEKFEFITSNKISGFVVYG